MRVWKLIGMRLSARFASLIFGIAVIVLLYFVARRRISTDKYGGYRSLPDRLSEVYPALDTSSKNYTAWNERTVRELRACVALENCGPNQRKVALLATHWFEEAIFQGGRSGECVWAVSVTKHLRRMGYTIFFAKNFQEALQQYRMFPDLVMVVIGNKVGNCHADPQCVKSPSNPTGIPAWKIFDFEYWPSPGAEHHGASLMEGKWILSANPDQKIPSPIQYIGFSIEEECMKLPAIPLADRPHRVFMLMKQLTYIYDAQFSWNRSYFSLASASEPALNNIQFVGAWSVDEGYGWDPKQTGYLDDIEDRSKGVVNLVSKSDANSPKKLVPEQWEREVAHSKVMLGVGNPSWSPSPYHALCLGVPFVNPVKYWDGSDPWNKEQWRTQHPTIQEYDPPYVYHVHARNYTGFVEAIRLASSIEIPRTVPKYMTEEAVRQRLQILMETDWKKEAKILLEERLKEKAQGRPSYIFEV